MTRLLRLGWWVGVLGVACGPAAVSESSQCLSLKHAASSAELVTSAPAKISMLFSVDTCDGRPLAGLDASSFELSEDGKPVSALESQRTIRPRGQRYGMSSLLLLDLSGSVLRSGSFGALEDAAKSYAHTVLQGADDGEQLAVMTFDGRASPQLVVPFTNDEAAVQRGLASLEVRECTVSADCSGTADRRSCAGWRCVDDSTNLYGAVMASLDALDTELIADPSIPWKDAALVVFTDGSDQAGRVSATVALSRAAAAKPRVFTVGLGGEVDQAVLQRLGRDGYFPASKASDLDAAFTAVAGRVTAQANRFYVLEYCSPKRSGLHTLKVTATAPTPQGPPLRGGLSADFDATGFESGCVVQ